MPVLPKPKKLPYVHVVDGDHKFRLADVSPGGTDGLEKEQAKANIRAIEAEFSELEDLLAYAGSHSLLIVIQGRDAAGKDGLARRIIGYSNVQTLSVSAFKVPTEEELSHDFLWRIHRRCPAQGELAIFNRSHYEDVIATRVNDLVPASVWKRRYSQINAFEETLADANTIVLKFFLHISKDEQEERLLRREQDPTKFWKLNPSDWLERSKWDKATEAIEDAINRCSSKALPWYVVSANKKWYRDLAVMHCIVETLRPYREVWLDRLNQIGRKAKGQVEAARRLSEGVGSPRTRVADARKQVQEDEQSKDAARDEGLRISSAAVLDSPWQTSPVAPSADSVPRPAWLIRQGSEASKQL